MINIHTVDLIACLHFREFLGLGLFTKFRLREFSSVFSSVIIVKIRDILEFANLSSSRKLKPREYYQTDRYFIDRKKVNPDLFVIEIDICTCIYNIVNLLKSYDNIHSMTYITKIMLTGIAIRNTGYILKIRLKGIARVT